MPKLFHAHSLGCKADYLINKQIICQHSKSPLLIRINQVFRQKKGVLAEKVGRHRYQAQESDTKEKVVHIKTVQFDVKSFVVSLSNHERLNRSPFDRLRTNG